MSIKIQVCSLKGQYHENMIIKIQVGNLKGFYRENISIKIQVGNIKGQCDEKNMSSGPMGTFCRSRQWTANCFFIIFLILLSVKGRESCIGSKFATAGMIAAQIGMHSHCTHPVLYFASLFLLKSASREAVEKCFCVVNDFVDNRQISRIYSTNFLKQLNLFMLGLGRVFFTRKQKGVEILVSMLLTGSIE